MCGARIWGKLLQKDILNLVYLSRYFNLDEVGDYWEQVIKINDWQIKRIYKVIVQKLFGNLSDKKIVILGFAFKANTNDTRESPAIKISLDLLSENANLVFHDPKVTFKQIKRELEKKQNSDISNLKISYNDDILKASKDADAIIIITEWDIYKKINWQKISKVMRKPSWVFDARGIINLEEVKGSGVNLWQVGNGYSGN